MLEDEFVDVLRKAKRGAKLDDAALATATSLEAASIAAWTRGDAVPSHEEAERLARALRLDLAKFADSAAERWHPHVTLPANVRHHRQFSTPESNGYLLLSETDRTVALIDPAGDPQSLLDAVAATTYALRYIVITHKHADHCESAGAVKAAHPQATIVVHAVDAFAIGDLAREATTVADGERVPFGEGAFVALHTPGHTDGSTCYLAGDVVFTGDTLFAGSVGGAFGDRSTYADILSNVNKKLLTLDADVKVMPGHGPPSTIAEERAHNPFFV